MNDDIHEPHAALEQWFRHAPGGRYLPDGFMDIEPGTLVTVSGGDSDRWFWRLFTACYKPDAGPDANGESVYTVPRIVAEALVWYGGEEVWWAEWDDPEVGG